MLVASPLRHTQDVEEEDKRVTDGGLGGGGGREGRAHCLLKCGLGFVFNFVLYAIVMHLKKKTADN